MSETWPFDQPQNAAAITSRQVLENGLPVLKVTHYWDDGCWAFVCGTTNDTAGGRVVSMAEALKLDPTLRSIANPPKGWSASRKTIEAEWARFQITGSFA